ncbi:MAG: 4Fe-4S dicluster domain-containing protein [Gammaproteobacteria bacterium]|nr:MAG: 4Fe-4S dicluster domain-containing protein [Gammaproteobacteria bacterium]
MSYQLSLLVYALPFLLIFWAYLRHRRKTQYINVSTLRESEEAGMTEPPSLHPLIDPTKCVGCAACVNACPEMYAHRVLGIIRGKAELISPTDCIGHGACFEACPVGAITLVFGTERRGVEIPHVKPNFETNVPGVFIAGELGGMGLIRNAIEQGRQAVESMRKLPRSNDPAQLDLLIVGAGPAGFSASLAAMEMGLRCVTVEQEVLGGTVAHFPRGKLVMTAPAKLPIVGKFQFRETTKERLIEFFTEVERDTGLKINYRERVEAIERDGDGFVVRTTANSYRARQVLLAIGRRGTPRKLEVPGEELPKVAYRLIDPEQYAGQKVLVVGGGDSALEAAWSIAEVPGSSVLLSYRSGAFTRAKQKNRERVRAAQEAGRLRVELKSQVAAIAPDHVRLVQEDREFEVPNDSVIINAGGILPNDFLRSIGIEVETKYGTA